MRPARSGVPYPCLPWLAGLVLATSLACQSSDPGPVVEPLREVLGYGTARFDADTGQVTFSATGPSGALLDASDVLPNATAHNCEAAGWNPGTLVLSVNAMIANQSASTTYLTPIELRLTGITEAGVVNSVNTDLINAACGANGLSLAADDGDSNGRFDCIEPDDSDTSNDPGWDFSSAVGTDDELAPTEWSACRFIHFNLLTETNFVFSYAILGVVDDGWPPAPAIDPVTTPTALPSQTVTGACVVTSTPPDTGGPTPTTNEVTVLGGSSPVTVGCTPGGCQDIGGIVRCGTFSASVPLRSNTDNRLEIYQTLDDVDRGGSSYVTIVHDDMPPQVAATQPANGALGVVPAADVLVTFSEVMDATTIDITSVYVREQGQTAALPATVTLGGGGTQVVVNPDTNFDDNTTYEIVVTTAVADLAGNNLAAQVVTDFTTAEGVDTIPPAVVNIQPANGASNVDRRTEVIITFSEAIEDLVAGDVVVEDVVRAQTVPGTYALSPDRTQITFFVDADYDSTGPDIDGTGCVASATPTPESDFDCSSYYRVTVTTGIEDLSGNPLPNPYVSTFSTGVDPDTVPPTVDGFIPPTGAVGVSESIQPRVLFSEPISPSTVTTSTLFLKLDGVTLVPATVSVAGDGLSAKITPVSLLSLGTRYVIFVNNGIQDLAGNPLAAPANSDFTTAAAPDTTPPTVVAVDPPDGAEDVSRTTDVTIQFSEPLDPATVNTGTVLLDEMRFVNPSEVNQAVEGQVTLSPDGLVVTFTPFEDLRRWRVHRLTLTTGITDLAGNPLAADFVSTFEVERDDDVPPCVIGISPSDGGANVPENSHIGVVFSEAMYPASVVESAFTLTGPGGPIAKSVSLSGDQAQVLITPTGNMPAGTINLTVTDALEDDSVEQNALDQGSGATGCLDPSGGAELQISFDVVGLSDVTGPQVVIISPPDGATDVSVATDVVITFSEPIDPLTATSSDILLLTDPSGNPQGMTRTFSSDLRVATFDPTTLLLDLTAYNVTIPTSVRDLAGNPLQQTVVSYFTTGDSSLDTTPPSVVSTCPVDDAIDVPRDLVLPCNTAYPGKVVIQFDEPLNGDTVHVGTVQLVQVGLFIENVITESVELLPGGTTVLITPEFLTPEGLRNARYHQIRVSPAVTDTAGNPLNAVDNCNLGTGADCNDFDT